MVILAMMVVACIDVTTLTPFLWGKTIRELFGNGSVLPVIDATRLPDSVEFQSMPEIHKFFHGVSNALRANTSNRTKAEYTEVSQYSSRNTRHMIAKVPDASPWGRMCLTAQFVGTQDMGTPCGGAYQWSRMTPLS